MTRRLKAPDNRVVLGVGGSGKSYLVKHWLKKRRHVVVFNTAAEADYERPGCVVVNDRHALVRALQVRANRISWRGDDMSVEAWEFVNRAVWCAEGYTLVWEEADQFWPPSKAPQWASNLVNQGRHRGIRLIACSRRPAVLSRTLTANARVVAFATVEPRDLMYMRERMGAAAARLPDLPRWTALDHAPPAEAVVKKSPFA